MSECSCECPCLGRGGAYLGRMTKPALRVPRLRLQRVTAWCGQSVRSLLPELAHHRPFPNPPTPAARSNATLPGSVRNSIVSQRSRPTQQWTTTLGLTLQMRQISSPLPTASLPAPSGLQMTETMPLKSLPPRSTDLDHRHQSLPRKY